MKTVRHKATTGMEVRGVPAEEGKRHEREERYGRLQHDNEPIDVREEMHTHHVDGQEDKHGYARYDQPQAVQGAVVVEHHEVVLRPVRAADVGNACLYLDRRDDD